MGVPVNGETIDGIIADNALATGNGNVGFFYYDNDTTTGFAGTGFIFYQPSSTGPIVSARGYGIQLGVSGDVTFSGSVLTSDASISISEGTMGDISPNPNNLIANPYPSYVAGNLNANANNLLSNNTGILSEETMWFWDNTIFDYVPINNGSPAFYVAPGQGFFVSSTMSGGTFNILEAWQSHQITEVFYKNSTSTFRINLTIKNEQNKIKKTAIYYIEGKTMAFDNGFDSSKFSIDDNFDIYTKLIGDNESNNLAIQTLPAKNIENLAVPLGVIANRTFSISTKATNIPKGISIYLEDKLLNTWTELKNGISYTIRLENEQTGIGRFYLHTKSSILDTENQDLNDYQIYVDKNKNLILQGFTNNSFQLAIYDLLGKEKFTKKIHTVNFTSKEISLKDFSSGVYFVQIKSDNQIVNKKILLK